MKKLWGKKVSDLKFQFFCFKLEYVSSKYGTVTHKIDRWFASSKTCTCGVVNKELKLSDRVGLFELWRNTHSRDLLITEYTSAEGIVEYRVSVRLIYQQLMMTVKNPLTLVVGVCQTKVNRKVNSISDK